jgi:predicted metal-dependent TIM-barrel fold hydrolase
MRIIDMHIHMYSRTTEDYERMALSGIEAVIEPAFWGGCDKTSPDSHLDYFNHLTTFEPARAAKRNIRHYVVLGMNAKEAENTEIAFEVIERMQPLFERPNVIGVGEIGLNLNTENEIEVLRRQLEYARDTRQFTIIHTPHVPKLEGVKIILRMIGELGLDPSTVDVDHNTEETIELTLAAGCWAGMTIYPTKLSPERAVNMIEQYGVERLLVNSSADWETSDPLAVCRVAWEMRRRGLSAGDIGRIVWDNPRTFLSHSPKFRLDQ